MRARAAARRARGTQSLGAVSRGVLVPTFRDDLVESAAIVEAMRAGDVEPTRAMQNALDVLAQSIVAMVSVDDWTAGDAFALVRRAYPYHRLTRAAFDEVLVDARREISVGARGGARAADDVGSRERPTARARARRG